MRALLYIIPIMLLSAVICYGSTDVRVKDTVRVVDTTPKSWVDYVTAGSTVVLAVFTIVLAGATWFYARQTKKHVNASNELLASNRELIKLNEAQNDIIKAQLLGKVYDLSLDRGAGKGNLMEQCIGPAIRAYLNRAAIDLLGEFYKTKARVRLRDNYAGSKKLHHIEGLSFSPGEAKDIPRVLWDGMEDPDFKFIEYVEPEQSSEQDNTA